MVELVEAAVALDDATWLQIRGTDWATRHLPHRLPPRTGRLPRRRRPRRNPQPTPRRWSRNTPTRRRDRRVDPRQAAL